MLSKIKNKLNYEIEKFIQNRNSKKAKKCFPLQNVASIDETLDKLLLKDFSMCRYGDGEFKVMLGQSNGFQQKDKKLAQRLRQIIISQEEGVLLCIPNVTSDMQLRTSEAVSFWNFFLKQYGGGVAKLLSPKIKYYNAHVTRLYMDYQHCGRSSEWFERLKSVWDGKEILIVEGEKTHIGVGNDLFSNALCVKRILCPSKSAFSVYDEILDSVKENYRGELVLIALGLFRYIEVQHRQTDPNWTLAEQIYNMENALKEVDKDYECKSISKVTPFLKSPAVIINKVPLT